MQKIDSKKALLLQRKAHLFWHIVIVIWEFSKHYASEAPTHSWF